VQEGGRGKRKRGCRVRVRVRVRVWVWVKHWVRGGRICASGAAEATGRGEEGQCKSRAVRAGASTIVYQLVTAD
jgi:hypothetical protein